MASVPSSSGARTNADGVTTVAGSTAHRVLWLAASAIGVVVLLVVAVLVLLPALPRTDASTPIPIPTPTASAQREPLVADVAPTPAAPATAATAKRATPRRRAAKRPTPAPPPAQAEIRAEEVIPALRAAGETEGIAAFGVPGTDPPKSGLIVPDDFAVPEGYVRHHQVTDDGEQLPPILMFHPDYELVDEQGQPIELPADRVVPPEMAPPGMPIQQLEVARPKGGAIPTP